jgi:hypothetical protein
VLSRAVPSCAGLPIRGLYPHYELDASGVYVHNGEMSEARKTLVAAREIVADKKRYAPGAFARDSNGNPITVHGDAMDALDERAKSWDAFGAVWRCSEPTRASRYDAIGALCIARQKRLKRNVAAETPHFQNEAMEWLSNMPVETVLEVFDLAIAATA